MPSGKNYRKKKYYKKKQLPTRWQTYGAAGSQLVKDVIMLKGLINTEFKYRHISGSLLPLDTATAGPSFILFNGIAQGTSAFERVGRSIKVASFQLNFNVQKQTSVADTKVRVILLLDTQANGAQPTINQILSSTTDNEIAILSPRNLNNRKRFIILRNWMFALNDGVKRVQFVKYYRKFGFHTQYDSNTGGGIASIISNSLHLVAFSNQTGASSPDITYEGTIRYIDN